MRMRHTGKAALTGALFLSIGLFLLAACGSNTGSTGSLGNAATATACAQTTRPATANRTALGTIASISGQSLVLNTIQTNASQSKTATVTYTSSTTFTQEVKLAPSDLKEGSNVRVTVTSSGSSYTAVNVAVTTGTGTGAGGGFGGFGGGFGGFGGGRGTPGVRGTVNPCFTARGRGTATTGRGTATTGNNTSFRGLSGTVSQVNGNILVIADTSGSSFTVNLTAQTQIIETKSATAAALKVGEPITALGKAGSSRDAFTATSIAILLTLPTRPNATATPAA